MRIETCPPRNKCEGCNKIHSKYFWHCADEFTWGTLATCTYCRTLNSFEENPMYIWL